MKVLVDSDVILDFLIRREPYYENALRVVELCSRHRAEGFMAAHSITNLFYLLRKDFSDEERREALLNILDIFTIESIDQSKLKSALLDKDFRDFEDCLQTECGLAVNADYIITRNINDYKESRVKVIKPDAFCELFAD